MLLLRLRIEKSPPLLHRLTFFSTVATLMAQVIFDEEFMGGKGLQGSCSQFRGKLCRWSDLLLVSPQAEFRDFKKKKSDSALRSYSQVTVAQLPPPAIPAEAVDQGSTKKLLSVLKRPAQASSATPTKARAAATATAVGAPASTTAASAAAGDKVKALSVLKEQLGIIKKEHAPPAPAGGGEGDELTSGESSNDEGNDDDDDDIPYMPSNGTGQLVLAEAAGYGADDLNGDESLLPSQASIFSQNPLLGVISYDAIPSSALVHTPEMNNPSSCIRAYELAPRRTPPSQQQLLRAENSSGRGGGRRHVGGSASRMVLDKEATNRILKHELKANSNHVSATAGSSSKGKGQQMTAKNSSAPITAIPTAANNKRVAQSKAAGGAVAAPAGKAIGAAGSTAKSNTAKLMSILSRPAAASDASAAPAVKDSSGAGNADSADTAAAAGDFAVGAVGKSPASTTPVAPGKGQSVASKLANAKRAMLERREHEMKQHQQQQQQGGGAAASQDPAASQDEEKVEADTSAASAAAPTGAGASAAKSTDSITAKLVAAKKVMQEKKQSRQEQSKASSSVHSNSTAAPASADANAAKKPVAAPAPAPDSASPAPKPAAAEKKPSSLVPTRILLTKGKK